MEEQVVEVDGLSIAYRQRGHGPPVVLLHGWPLDSREFSRQLDGLADTHRVIAWDAPGAGRSSDPPAGSSLDDWADWLAAFLTRLDLDQVHLAGLSWGGGLALAVAHRHPARVRSLTLMSAYAGWGGSLPEEETARRLRTSLENTTRPPATWIPSLLETLLPPGTGSDLAAELTSMLSELHPEGTRIALAAFAGADLRPALPAIEVPTLLLYGDVDVRSPREVREPIHAAIAGSTLVVLAGVGHMVDMQAPERCNAEIRSHVARVERDLAP